MSDVLVSEPRCFSLTNSSSISRDCAVRLQLAEAQFLAQTLGGLSSPDVAMTPQANLILEETFRSSKKPNPARRGGNVSSKNQLQGDVVLEETAAETFRERVAALSRRLGELAGQTLSSFRLTFEKQLRAASLGVRCDNDDCVQSSDVGRYHYHLEFLTCSVSNPRRHPSVVCEIVVRRLEAVEEYAHHQRVSAEDIARRYYCKQPPQSQWTSEQAAAYYFSSTNASESGEDVVRPSPSGSSIESTAEFFEKLRPSTKCVANEISTTSKKRPRPVEDGGAVLGAGDPAGGSSESSIASLLLSRAKRVHHNRNRPNKDDAAQPLTMRQSTTCGLVAVYYITLAGIAFLGSSPSELGQMVEPAPLAQSACNTVADPVDEDPVPHMEPSTCATSVRRIVLPSNGFLRSLIRL